MNFKTRRNILLKRKILGKYPILRSMLNEDSFRVSYFIPDGIDTKVTDCGYFIRDAMKACEVFGKKLQFGSGDYFIKSRFALVITGRTK
jgi:hypothetical protein